MVVERCYYAVMRFLLVVCCLLALFSYAQEDNSAQEQNSSNPNSEPLQESSDAGENDTASADVSSDEVADGWARFWQDVAYKGEFGFLSGATASQTGFASSFGLKAHLELGYENDAMQLRSVLDPALRINPNITSDTFKLSDAFQLDIGLSELYFLYRQADWDISFGKERLPLETARLTLPFSLEPRSSSGAVQGVWGARAIYFPADFRLRSAVFFDAESIGGDISAKYFFGDMELEAHLIYDRALSFGVTGSGLIDTVVFYGESWLLVDAPLPWNKEERATQFRLLLGANGFVWNDIMWTLEAGYLPIGNLPSMAQLWGQISVPNTGLEAVSVNLQGSLRLPETGLAATLGAALEWQEGEGSRQLLLELELSQQQPRLRLGWQSKGYY